MNVSKDTPLAEITLRKYEKPYDMPRRDLIRKICLSTGLLQPGDSRDVVVDIFHVLLDTKQALQCEDIRSAVIAQRDALKLPRQGVAASNIRRQLRRLRELHFVEKVKNSYRVNEHEHISVLFTERIEQFILPAIVARVKEYLEALR